MLFESKIGKLIRKLNPYTNGSMNTMLCGSQSPIIDPNLGAMVSALGTALTNYANNPDSNTLKAVNTDEGNIDGVMDVTDIHLAVDNDFHQDYMTWTFRGQPRAVKRALRITYRYQLTDRQGNSTGIYVTDHVLVGYCGANG